MFRHWHLRLLSLLTLFAAVPLVRAEELKLLVDDGLFERESFVRQLAVSRDDRYVLLSDFSSGVSFYDSRSGELLNRWSAHSLAGDVYYDNASDTLITTGDRTVRVWDVGKQKLLSTFRQSFHSQFMNGVYLEPSKQFIFAQNVKYSFDTGKVVKRYKYPQRDDGFQALPGLPGMHFFLDRYVVFEGSGQGTIYEATTDRKVGNIAMPVQKGYLSFHVDPRRGEAYLATTEGFQIIDLSSGAQGFLRFERKNDWALSGHSTATCVTADGRYLVAASELKGGHLVVLEKRDPQKASFADNAREIYRDAVEVSDLACLNTRAHVLFATHDNIALLDITTKKVLWRKSPSLLPIHRLALDPSGKRLGIEFGIDPHWKRIEEAWTGDVARYFQTSPRQSYQRRFRPGLKESELPPQLRRFFRQRVRLASVDLDGNLSPRPLDSLQGLQVRGHEAGALQPIDAPVPSASGKRRALVRDFHEVTFYQGDELLLRAPARGVIYELIYSNDESLAAFGGADRRVTVVDLVNKKLVATISAPANVSALDFSRDNQRVYIGTRKNEIWIFDLAKKTVIAKLGGFNGEVVDLLVSKDDRLLISAATDSALSFWDLERNKLVLSAYYDVDLGFAALTPEGYFDKSQSFSLLAWSKQGVRCSLDQYYEKFFRPDLVRAALSRQDLGSLPSIKEAGVPPGVEIAEAPSDVNGREARITVGLKNAGSGIGDVRIYVNGTAIKLEKTRGLMLDGDRSDVRRAYTVPLAEGRNEIRVRAFNADNSVQSESSPTVIMARSGTRTAGAAAATGGGPNLHALVIGIDVYENPKLNLRYARADAELFAQSLEAATQGLFGKRDIRLLRTPSETTKDSILEALRRFAGLPADDMFVLYIASHGVVDEGVYYLLPSNTGSLSSSKVRRDALSQDEITERVINIPAQKKLIVLDTCSAGALGDALQAAVLTRGLTQATAVKVLARAVGTTILSAATSAQEALEGYRGHGLFTFVVSESLKGRADLNKDGFVKTTELADYVDDEVPRLAEEVFGHKQYPTVAPSGQGFPVARVR